MSHLPPPPPNAAPYAPPPPHSAPQYPPAYPPTQGHEQYQQPAPTSAQAPSRGGWAAPNGYAPHSSPPRGPPTGAPKSRMQVTRYPPPPGRPQHQAQQYPGPYQQPPPAYPPPANWGAPQPYAPPPTSYPPPPHAAPYPNAPPNYPPPPQQPPQQPPYAPPQQAPYPGYPPQPPPHIAPPPPPHAAYQQPYAPPPNPQVPPAWGAPQAQPPPQQGWGPSPPPAALPPQVGPPTPAPTAASSVAPFPPPSYAPAPPKDLKDPTFYDGWDDNDYEWGGALWPKASEVIDERFSLGQYIWHPPQRISIAISLSIDEELKELPRPKADEPPPKVDFSVSKYWKSESNSEGDEFVFNFQRIRYIDEWDAIKDDPIFIRYPEDGQPQPVPVQTILPEVLKRDRELKEDQPQEDVMDRLEKALEMYIPNPNTVAGAQPSAGHPDAAIHSSKQEALLASLGVSGVPKPVYSTPFPAYAPVTEDPLFGRPPAQRTVSSSSQPTHRPPPPPAPVPPRAPSPHHRPPPAPSPHQRPPPTHRPPPAQEWKDPEDPWKAINEFNATNPTPSNRPTTPVGSDFGDLPVRGDRSSSEKTVKDENSEAAESKKRKADEPDTLHRKRSKARIVSEAYQRRW